MPGQSLTNIIGGPALITYRGATFRSKGDIRMNMELERFPIETSLYGQVDERVREHPLKLSFVPDGEWSNLGILWPYGAFPFGQYLTPQLYFGAIAANQINVGSTAVLQSGDAFVANSQNSGTMTVGLTAGNTYYFHIVSATNVSVHTTYANAVAGTNPISISAGTGIVAAVVNNPLTIQTIDGFLWTFGNVAVSKMANLSLSTVRTAVGEIEFSVYLVDGQDWSGASSLYTYVQNPWPGDTGFAPSSILTGEIGAVWRNMSAPWASFDTKDGWEVDFNMELTPVGVDNVGHVCDRLSGLVVRAKAIPIGVRETDVANALYLQGTNAARGRSLNAFGNDLLLSAVANNLGCKIFAAALEGGPALYSNKVDRIGPLSWVATRGFSGSGPNALFSIGNASVT